jgi:pimeloyl-ACP methyl ester carboxylesterase
LETIRLGLNGFELNAERWECGARAHVLLLHGLGGNSVTWHGVAPSLAASLRGTVLAVDLPGFGRSRTAGRDLHLRALTDLVEAVLRAAAPAGIRWLIAGNSLGAVLALEVAQRAPASIGGISLVAPALPLRWGRDFRGLARVSAWVPPALPWLGRRLIARYARRTGLPGVVDEPVRALFGDPTRLDPELRERLLAVSAYRFGWAREAARAYEQVTRSLGVALLSPSAVEGSIREVTCPVQVISGTRDPLFDAATFAELGRRRPDWERVVLEDIGHVPQLEAPREVTRHLLDWFGRLAVAAA